MIYFQIQSKEGKIFAGDMQNFSRYMEFNDNRNFSDHKNGIGVKGIESDFGSIKIWIVVENESDLLKSSKLFKRTIEIYRNALFGTWDYYVKQINAHAHTLTTIQGKMRQKIEGFAKDEQFYGETYINSLNRISELVNNDNDSAADVICYLHKRVADMRAHMLGFEIIRTDVDYKTKLINVSLRGAILNLYTPFITEFSDKNILVRLFFDDDCIVSVDRDLFSLAMYNFFDNATKYSKPNSEIRMYFHADSKMLDISMISLKMEKSEIKGLFNEGVRGMHAKDFPGNGVGLFVLRRALKIMDKDIYIRPVYEKDVYEDGVTYIENHFEFNL